METIIYIATAIGLFIATQTNGNWENIYQCYIRALWVDPANARHIIAGPADGAAATN